MPAQPTGPAHSPHFIVVSPGLLKSPRPSLSSTWLLPSTKIVFTTVTLGTPMATVLTGTGRGHRQPHRRQLAAKAAGQRAQTGPTADTPGMLGAGWPLTRDAFLGFLGWFFFQQHAVTVTDSRRTGTSIYNISRVKQTTGWRRRSETPANLRGGLGRARAATGTTGMAATARLGPAHRLPAIRDGVGVAMLPLPVAPKATAGGKRCGQDRWLSTTSTSQVWFLGGLGFRLPPQSLSASLRRQRAAKLLPRHANQA